MPAEPAASPAAAPPQDRRWLVLLGLLALVLRLFDLGRNELWVDEGITWFFARMLGNFELGEQLRLEPTPPLYYALIGLLLRLFGDSDLLLRLPSAIAGALASPLVAILGQSLGWRRAGLAAGLLLAVHPWHLFLSREARVYPLLLALFLGLAIALRRAFEQKTLRAWTAVAVLLVLLLYSHLFGLFVAAALAVLILFQGGDREGRRRGLAAVGLALLLFAPYLLVALPALSGSGVNWSQELLFDALPEERLLPRIVEGQLIGARYHLLQRELAQPATPPLFRWPALVAQAILLAAAGLLGRRPGRDRHALLFVAILYLLPFLLPWAAGMIAGKVFFQPGRHDFLALGPLCLLLGAGLEAVRRRSRALALLLLAPIAAAAFFRLAWLHLSPAGDSATRRGQYLATAAGPGDLAIAFDLERLLGERYTRLAGGDLIFESFPADTDRHPGYADPRPLLRQLPQLRREADARLRRQQGRGRIFTLERPTGPTGRPPGWEVDALFVAALQEAGWQAETPAEISGVRLWRSP